MWLEQAEGLLFSNVFELKQRDTALLLGEKNTISSRKKGNQIRHTLTHTWLKRMQSYNTAYLHENIRNNINCSLKSDHEVDSTTVTTRS